MSNNNQCQYIGAGNTAPVTCNAEVSNDHSSYCAHHYPLVYREGSGRGTRHKDIRTANRVWDLQNELNQAVAELEAEGFM